MPSSEPGPVLTLHRRRPQDPTLVYQMHRPDRAPRLAVLLTHGYGEHRGRYAHVIPRWTEQGILVAAYDLRGHGGSGGDRGFVAHFDDYLRDMVELLETLEEDDAWRQLNPPVLFGHSLGGLISVRFALEAPQRVCGLSLSSPFFATANEVPLYKRLAGSVFSRVLPRFALPTGIQGRDVSHDPRVQHDYDHDPRVNKKATARWYTETTAAQRLCSEQIASLKCPLFCLYAGADKVASASATTRLLQRAGSADKQLRELPGLYHEILNEPDGASWADKFASAMLGWRPIRRDAETEH